MTQMMSESPLGTDLIYHARYEVYSDLSLLGGMYNDLNEDHGDGPSIIGRPSPDVTLYEKLRYCKRSLAGIMNSCPNPRETDWRKFRSHFRSAVPDIPVSGRSSNDLRRGHPGRKFMRKHSRQKPEVFLSLKSRETVGPVLHRSPNIRGLLLKIYGGQPSL